VPSEIDTGIERRDTAREAVELGEGRTTALTDTSDAVDATEDAVGSETDRNPEDPETEPEAKDAKDVEPAKNRRQVKWSRVFAYGVLPALALILVIAAGCLGGYLIWQNTSDRDTRTARIESVAAAKDATIALLSYKPDTAEKDLTAARDRLTGAFKDSYTQLTHDVVIPGAKQKQISAVATVPALASVKATPNHAVVLLYVNQSTVIGTDAPSDSVSTVRVTLENVHGRWLVSDFDPI
jgi:Mce-associated membrane protein